MTSDSVPSPLGNPTNPIDPSAGEAPAASEESSPEAVRRAHLGEEAYVKAVGGVHYIYAVLFILHAGYFLRLTYLHLTGKISAPWSVRPGWIALQLDWCLVILLTLVAGYGFRRLKPWALWMEGLFVFTFLTIWPLSIFAYSRETSPSEFAGGVLLMAALLVPLIGLWDLRESILFTPAYGRAITATPHAEVRARLPLELKILTFLLIVTAATFYVFTATSEGQMGPK